LLQVEAIQHNTHVFAFIKLGEIVSTRSCWIWFDEINTRM